MTRLLLIIVLLTQMGCAVLLETAGGSFVGHLGAELVKDKLDKIDEAPNVPADGMVGIDSDDNLYILKP